MNEKELFEKIIQFHTVRDNILKPLEDEGYDQSFIDKVERQLDQHLDDYEHVWEIDGFEDEETGERVYFISYTVNVCMSVSVDVQVIYVVPDDLTIRNMKINRIINSDFSKE